MAKLKLREGTKYPFKHLEKVGQKILLDGKIKNIRASLAMYKKANPMFDVIITQFDDGTITATRTS